MSCFSLTLKKNTNIQARLLLGVFWTRAALSIAILHIHGFPVLRLYFFLFDFLLINWSILTKSAKKSISRKYSVSRKNPFNESIQFHENTQFHENIKFTKIFNFTKKIQIHENIQFYGIVNFTDYFTNWAKTSISVHNLHNVSKCTICSRYQIESFNLVWKKNCREKMITNVEKKCPSPSGFK